MECGLWHVDSSYSGMTTAHIHYLPNVFQQHTGTLTGQQLQITSHRVGFYPYNSQRSSFNFIYTNKNITNWSVTLFNLSFIGLFLNLTIISKDFAVKL